MTLETSGLVLTVTAGGARIYISLEVPDIKDIVESIGMERLLEEIGEKDCREYFNIQDNED